MTLPTARENARLSWGDEPHSVPDDDKVKMLSMQHAVQATERRDKDIAKELQRIGEDTFNNYPDNPVEAFKFVAGEINKLKKQLDGEKV